MVKEKDKVVNEMVQLISNMNCSDSHCEDCFFKSHCCMCVGALELLYDNGYRKIPKNALVITCDYELPFTNKDECDFWKARCIETLDLFTERLKDIVIKYRGVGCGVHPLYFDIVNLFKEFKDFYEK